MAKAVLQANLVAAKDVSTLNANFKYASGDIDNGNVFQKGDLSTAAGEEQTYIPTLPATDQFTDLWMAFSPEDVILSDAMGNDYKIGINDPRNFTNIAGTIFSGFKPQVGDIITLTADGISGDSNDYVIPANSTAKLAFAAAALDAGLSFKVLDTTYLSIPSGTWGSQRVTAYKLECVQI